MIYDILLCAVLVLAFFIGTRRGLLKTAWGLVSLVAAIILASIFHPTAVKFFKQTPLADNIAGYVSEKLTFDTETVDFQDSLPHDILPETELNPGELGKQAADTLSQTVTNSAIGLICGILLFIAIRILLSVVYHILNVIFKFPVIKQTNKLLGGIIQTVLALAAVYAVLAVTAISGTDILNGSYLCKLIYENNLLISLFART